MAMSPRTDILPVIIGGDFGVYGIGRCFNEAFGCRCLCVGSLPTESITGSNFFDVRYNGSATMHSFGINIGAQWLFGRRKNIVLDWHILGVGRGFARGGFTANFDDVSHTVLEEAVRSELLSMTEQAVFTFDNKTDNNVKVSNLKYQSYIFNMGLSLGFRF